MNKIPLSENHKRSVSSSIFLLERLTNEIDKIIAAKNDSVMTDFEADESDKRKTELIKAVGEIRKQIAFFAEKYELDKQEVVQSRYISSRKTKMWEILGNTKPKRLKGFGEFPLEYKEEFENDLDTLINLIEKI